MYQDTAKQALTPLLVSGREAAKLLSISERTLFALTKDGQLPAVRFGRNVRYDPRDLAEWIQRAKNSRKAS